MIESRLRALFTEIADDEPGSSGVDTQLAQRRGRPRLLWRRAGVAGAPVLAAAVVAAVAGAVFTFGAGRQVPPRADHGSAGGPSSAIAPRRFNPLVPYAGFGWLPAGRHLTSVMTAGEVETFEVGTEGSRHFVGLNVYLPGQCNHSSGQILALLRGHQHPQLACTLNWGGHGGHPTLTNPVTAVAAPVNGHQAFWAGPVCNTRQCDPGAWSPGGSILVWTYAPGAWAILTGHNRTQVRMIADKIGFGVGASQPFRFPAQLTGVPPDWRVPVVQSDPRAGVLAAYQWYAGSAASAPSLIVGPASPRVTTCSLQPASAVRHRVINGYHVATTTTRQGSQVCAAHADGLQVYIFTGAGVTPNAPAIFAHHLRLLGPNPAHWTTRPIG
jgi:hypothetical protein